VKRAFSKELHLLVYIAVQSDEIERIFEKTFHLQGLRLGQGRNFLRFRREAQLSVLQIFLFGVFFNSEDGGDKLLRNVA
jgi:hypothetical protein